MRKLILILFLIAGVALADQGMTSAAHSANAGKIVFSTELINFKKEDPSKFRDSFKLGEPIYGRLYFKQSMLNTPLYHDQGGAPLTGSHREGAWELLVYVDGVNQNVKFGNFALGRVSKKAEREWTTWQLNLQPEQRQQGEKNIIDPWVKVAARLKPGTHKIKLVFRTTLGQYRSKPMAEGSFDLIVEEGASFSGGEFPKSTYSGSDLNSVREAMKRALVGPVAKSSSEIVDVAVTSGWRSGRYTDSKLEYRKIQGTVLWADSDGDGVLRYTSYSFIQNREGNGWSTLRFKAFVNGGPEGNVTR